MSLLHFLQELIPQMEKADRPLNHSLRDRSRLLGMLTDKRQELESRQIIALREWKDALSYCDGGRAAARWKAEVDDATGQLEAVKEAITAAEAEHRTPAFARAI